ncbi:MAG: DNA primase, partial [Bacteroidales bacterium]|nr:DNA primase [Bacteroidales bacterium]
MIEQSTIEHILDTARIEDVIGDFVALKRRGADYKGLCPFHQDKNPSLSVSPARNIYKCFSCGKAGNVITFLKEHEQMNYVEALRYLARKYGIEIEETVENEEDAAKRMHRES